MADSKDYSPRIKHVLKSYRSSAVNGLHGPSSLMNSESDVVVLKDKVGSCSQSPVHGYKKWLLKHQIQNSAKETDFCDVVTSSEVSNKCHISSSECDSANKLYDVGTANCDISCQTSSLRYVETFPDKCHAEEVITLAPNYVKDYATAFPYESGVLQIPSPRSYIIHSYPTKWCVDAPSVTPPSPYSCEGRSALGGSPAQPPFPLVMGSADEAGIKGQVILEGDKISCFSVGGEQRLCFAQVLTLLSQFTMPHINRECTTLHIYLSLCSPRQLISLKRDKDIPEFVKSCGLITYSDAHRLTHAFLKTTAPRMDPPRAVTLPYNSITRQFEEVHTLARQQTALNEIPSTNPLIPNILVSHRCFGKCRGWVYLQLYQCVDAKCVQCTECLALFSPQQFVSHAHSSLENKTCHWGFDPQNWRIYLQLASAQPLQTTDPAELPEVYLQRFKNKFDLQAIKLPTLQIEPCSNNGRNIAQRDNGAPRDNGAQNDNAPPRDNAPLNAPPRDNAPLNAPPRVNTPPMDIAAVNGALNDNGSLIVAPRVNGPQRDNAPLNAPPRDNDHPRNNGTPAVNMRLPQGQPHVRLVPNFGEGQNVHGSPPQRVVVVPHEAPPALSNPNQVVPHWQHNNPTFRDCPPNVALAPRQPANQGAVNTFNNPVSRRSSTDYAVPSTSRGTGQSFGGVDRVDMSYIRSQLLAEPDLESRRRMVNLLRSLGIVLPVDIVACSELPAKRSHSETDEQARIAARIKELEIELARLRCMVEPSTSKKAKTEGEEQEPVPSTSQSRPSPSRPPRSQSLPSQSSEVEVKEEKLEEQESSDED